MLLVQHSFFFTIKKNFKGSEIDSVPVSRKDERLFRSEEFLKHVAQKIAPPGLVPADPDQQHPHVDLHLFAAVQTQVLKQALRHLRSESRMQGHRELWDGWRGIGHAQNQIQQ